MKIYTKLVIDMATDKILIEESFEYNGSVAHCGSSGGGGGGSQPANTTNVQTIREAPEIEARRLGLMDQAAITASQPLGLPAFQVAPLSTAERAAQTLAGQTGQGISALTGAQQRAGAAVSASQLDPSSAQFQRFLNPYNQFVLDEINRQSQMAQNQLQAKAIAEGAFGGGRQAIAAGEFERARLGKIGEAQFAGFGQALQGFQANQALQAQTGLGAAQVGLSVSDALSRQQTQDIQNLMATGGTGRAIEQATLEAARQTAVQQATDPYQRLSFLSDIQRGVPSSQQTVTQGFAPQTSPLAQAVGTGIAAYSVFNRQPS
jgi:hypothetical protein